VVIGTAALKRHPSGHDVGHVIHRKDHEIETHTVIIHDQVPDELPGKRYVPRH
jgi:metal-dependent HD superfamily phosphatase/phosphodiesterase